MRNARHAARVFLEKNRNKVGLCLYEVQAAYESGHAFPDAHAQWYEAQDKHAGDRTPPYGAPVCFKGGKHGHIAIYVGNGRVRSTDAGGAGKMATASIDWFRTAWGYSYLGWIGDLAGRTISFDRTIEVYAKMLRPGVDNSDSVRMLRYALANRGFLKLEQPLSLDRPGNKYTPAVSRAFGLWQAKKGHRVTGVPTRAQAIEFFAPNKHVKVL